MKLIKASEADFEFIYSVMKSSFPPEERRARDEARLVMNESDYTVYLVNVGDEYVGFVSVWELSDFAFVEHFATRQEHRGKGYGALALALLRQMYARIVLEAEPPENILRARRVAFYERAGFVANPRPYVQPSYTKGGPGVELVLMSYPSTLTDVERVVGEIYRRVYKTDKENP